MQNADARIFIVLQGKDFSKSPFTTRPRFCMPHSPEIQVQVDSAPASDGAAPSSREIGENVLCSGNHSRSIRLEYKMKAEFGEELETKVKS